MNPEILTMKDHLEYNVVGNVLIWMVLTVAVAFGLQIVDRFWVLRLCLGGFLASLSQVLWSTKHIGIRREITGILKQALFHCPTMVWLWARAVFRLSAAVFGSIARFCRSSAMFLVVALLCASHVKAGVIGSGLKVAGKALSKVEVESLSRLSLRNKPAAEWLCREYGSEAAERFLVQLTPEARELIAFHGPRAAALFRELGEEGTPLLRQFDEDLLRVFESQGKHTADWVGRYGADGVRLAGRVGVRQTEALVGNVGAGNLAVAMRAGRPAAAVLTRHPEMLPVYKAAVAEGSESLLLETFEKGGDRFLQFLQRNWKGAGVAALCAAFVTQPEAFTKPLADTASRACSSALYHLSHPGSAKGALLMLIVVGIPVLLITLRLLRAMEAAGRVARRIFRKGSS